MLRKLLPLLFGAMPIIAQANQEAQFWNWFVANQSALYRFTSPTDPVLDQLGSQLKQVNEDLTFEMGPVKPDGRREFIISADGMKAAFPAVESLYAAAPKLDLWQVIKYRPRRSPVTTLTLGEHTFDPATVRCLLAKDGAKIGIVLMYDDYKQNDAEFDYAKQQQALAAH